MKTTVKISGAGTHDTYISVSYTCLPIDLWRDTPSGFGGKL